MVVTVTASKVTENSIFVDRQGKHRVEKVREVRGQVALFIDGFWNYFRPVDMVNIFLGN